MSNDEKVEEETYSLIFSSLKHPIRRKILRMLAREPRAFSEILEAVSIDSGHLNYHLENLGDLITHTLDGKYGLSSVGVAAVGLMSGVEEHPPLPIGAPVRRFHRVSRELAMFLIPFVLLPCFWLFQQGAIDSKYFLELTFFSFIFLGIGAFLLLSSKIQEISIRGMKLTLYAVTILSLIVTLVAANSLVAVPRGETNPSFIEGYFRNNMTLTMKQYYTGGVVWYSGSVDENIYIENRSVSCVSFWYTGYGYGVFYSSGAVYLRIDSVRNVVLNGTIHVYFVLVSPNHPPVIPPWSMLYPYYPLRPQPESSALITYKWHSMPIQFQGDFIELQLDGSYIRWAGLTSPEERIRLSNYKIMLMIVLALSGGDYGPSLNFTIRPRFTWQIDSIPVISEFQNGLALVLCGVFAGIYIEIAGKGIIQAVKHKKRKQ